MKKMNVIKCLALSSIFTASLMSCENDNDDKTNASLKTFLFASNNSNGNITTYDVSNMSMVTSKSFLTASTAADGVYYDSEDDLVVQASRSNLSLEGFSNLSLSMTGANISVGISGSADMKSPRELAVKDDFYVVADNADVDGDASTPDGKLFIYTKSGSSFMLRNVITTDFKLWGITFDGDDLYAVVDATNQLAVYKNFLSNTSNTTLSATKKIAIEGIVRTHGLTYDAMSDTMIMTDIAAASNTQDDGAFHVIENFTSKFNNTANGATLAASQQTRIAGSATLLGNPVDVAYDSYTKTVFIAEAGNGGGRILAFKDYTNGGNISPVLNNDLASASSVYLSKY